MTTVALRQELIDAARAMNTLGINQGKAGNLSVRSGTGVLITPSGIAYDELTPDDIVFMTMDGAAAGSRKPSSEWRMHLDIHRSRPDVQAIVHTHSPFATTLACHARSIPAFHYMIAVAGGEDIRCAPYATFGTQALSDKVLAALADRKACLLAQHGQIALGNSIKASLALAVEVETLARMYWQALQIGEPPLLDKAEMQRVIAQFRAGYGQLA